MSNVSIVTLGVADLARSTAFYEALGWRNTTASQPTITFLQGPRPGGGLVLGLFPRDKLAEDAEVADEPSGFRAVTLAFNRPSREDVDAFFEQARAAGASEVKKPQAVFWGGYSGYFADPDGHLWEIAHNPFFRMSDDGTVTLETT